jgi:hypothetical protein
MSLSKTPHKKRQILSFGAYFWAHPVTAPEFAEGALGDLPKIFWKFLKLLRFLKPQNICWV